MNNLYRSWFSQAFNYIVNFEHILKPTATGYVMDMDISTYIKLSHGSELCRIGTYHERREHMQDVYIAAGLKVSVHVWDGI